MKYHVQAIRNKEAESFAAVTEEAIKQIDVAKEENVNDDELEVMMGSEESYGILKTDDVPVIDEVGH